jgi:hypothetical protein
MCASVEWKVDEGFNDANTHTLLEVLNPNAIER